MFGPKALKRIWWSDVLILHKALPYFPQCVHNPASEDYLPGKVKWTSTGVIKRSNGTFDPMDMF